MGLKTCLFGLIVVIVLMHVSTQKFERPFLCYLKHETGPCRGAHQRYAWDSNSGRCVEFTYGGCFGNANNFRTTEECNQMCSLANNETD